MSFNRGWCCWTSESMGHPLSCLQLALLRALPHPYSTSPCSYHIRSVSVFSKTLPDCFFPQHNIFIDCLGISSLISNDTHFPVLPQHFPHPPTTPSCQPRKENHLPCLRPQLWRGPLQHPYPRCSISLPWFPV